MLIGDTKILWRDFLSLWEEFLWNLPHERMKQLSKVYREIYRERWEKNKQRLSDGVNRVFTPEELERFFSVIDDERFYMMYSLQLYLALRIGEVVGLKLENLDLDRESVLIYERKTRRVVEKKIPKQFIPILYDYILRWKEKIMLSGGYLFPRDKGEGHITYNFARTKFYRYLKRAGLVKIYGYSKNGKPLYVLGTHSLRRTGITMMAKAFNGNVFLLRVFSGHKTIKSLEKYVYITDKETVWSAVDNVFSRFSSKKEQIKGLIQKMKFINNGVTNIQDHHNILYGPMGTISGEDGYNR